MGCMCCKRRVPEVLDETPAEDDGLAFEDYHYEIQEEIIFDPVESTDEVGPTCIELAEKDVLQLAKCCFAPLALLQWSSRTPRYLDDRKLPPERREDASTEAISVSQLPWDAQVGLAKAKDGINLAAKQAREVQAEIVAALRAKRATEDLAKARTGGEAAEIMAMPPEETLEVSAFPEAESDDSDEVLPKGRAGPRATVVAGSGRACFGDGRKGHASFNCPSGVSVDSSGNLIVADTINHRLRKITADGDVSTLAGTGLRGLVDGGRRVARFHCPVGVAVDSKDNVLVADYLAHAIRLVTPGGAVMTLAGSGRLGCEDGVGHTASFNGPRGIAVDYDGNLYVADAENHCIRKVRMDGTVTTLAGCGQKGFADGQGPSAMFSHPSGVAYDGRDTLFVSDSANHCIRMVTRSGQVTTWAGSGEPGFANGSNDSAQFHYPQGLAVDWQGNVLVSDSHAIRMISPDGTVTTPVGNGNPGCSDGGGNDASFSSPQGMAVDPEGNLLVADFGNNCIRKVTSIESNSARFKFDEMEMLLSDVSSADVTFLVSGELVMAHRYVLEKRAEHLAELLPPSESSEDDTRQMPSADFTKDPLGGGDRDGAASNITQKGTATATDPGLMEEAASRAAGLCVTIVGAEGLRSTDLASGQGSTSDAYCIASIQGAPGAQFATEVVQDRLNPTWNHTGELASYTPGDDLEFAVLDDGCFQLKDFLGKATLQSHEFYPLGFEGCIELSPGPGSLRVRVEKVAEIPAPQATRSPDAEVRDTTATAFRAVLRFLYTDRLACHDQDVIQVMELARRYDIRRVYKLCRLYVCRNLGVGNCAAWFVYADAYKIPEVREAALRAAAGFMQTNKLQMGASDTLAPLMDKPHLMEEVLSQFAGSRRTLKPARREVALEAV